MTRIVYVNGEYLPEEEARISVFDRGFLFADGVYEVSSVLRGRLIDNPGHMARLHRSLTALDMAAPATDTELEAIQMSLIGRNQVDEGLVYLQVTRGAADRDFVYPEGVKPSLVMFTQSKPLLQSAQAERGISVVTTEDIRWRRRDIKSVGLLAASMAKMIARRAGADDAWMVESGKVTEGSSSNAYILTREGTLVTRSLGHEILAGITREAVLRLARTSSLQIEERPFSLAEAEEAAEAFITSATTFVMPVVSIDGKPVGDGRPGPVTRQLRELYITAALEQTGR
ncbi:MAG: D-amino-acid transaminase [Chromatiaceae bacterium]|nr:D-amino-acid transaminase [Chromatiaceae bacterium]MCP5442257.1 D-amino-acid transaminase [Chromatiaceae bacterium]